MKFSVTQLEKSIQNTLMVNILHERLKSKLFTLH
jgi:hypothetical protein